MMRPDTIARLRGGGQKPAAELRRGDVVVVDSGEVIPADGRVIEGFASVDESAVTGESPPVLREPAGERSSVSSGTKVLSGHIVVRITDR
jgi:K+-transporting ATPase ATPase B chain